MINKKKKCVPGEKIRGAFLVLRFCFLYTGAGWMVKKQRSENQQGCDGEAEGIGHQERPEGRIFREGCVYPGNSYAADPKDGQDRGDEGDTKASQITGHDLIKHAENIGGENHDQPRVSKIDDLGITVEEGEQELSAA